MNQRSRVRKLNAWLVVAVAAAGLATTAAPGAGAIPTPAPASAPAVAPLPPVDLDSLVAEPVQQWGVVGTGLSDSSPKPQVWDFAEIGDRIYVAGTFTGVQRNAFDATSTVQPQAYLAAFDRDTGAWISTFAPQIDRTVYDLAVLPNGNLVAGGEFTQVNGQSRTALVALNPTTGATVSGWNTDVYREWSTARAVVRELVVDGNQLYVGGEFDHVRVNGTGYVVFSVLRVDVANGALDFGWIPRPSGGGVWDLAVDNTRNRVHLVGFFTSLSAVPGTARMGTISGTDGLPIPGLTPFENNSPSQTWTWAVAYADDRIFVGGSEHVIQVLDGGTNSRLGYNTTGVGCSSFYPANCNPRYVGGGDYQVLEAGTGVVFGGCHCYEARSAYPSYIGITHYSSFTDQRTNHKFSIAYDSSGGEPTSAFVPGLRSRTWGTWAIFTDSRGCYYVGGDYNRTAAGLWIGGFGRFCEAVTAPATITGVGGAGSVSLSWQAVTSQLPVARYRVYRDGTFVAETTNPSYTDGGRAAGATHTYGIETVDVTNRRSTGTTVTVTVGAADTTPPSTPTDLTATANGTTVNLTWTASTDNVAIKGYLVHRNGTYVAFIPVAAGTTYTHLNVPNGSHTYSVRAQDTSNNNSPAATVPVTVGAPDTTPPSTPTNLTATANGTTVNLAWTASTDNVAIKGYLVHRNNQYVAFVPVTAGTTYANINVPAGSHTYAVRAQDTSNNNSTPATVSVTVS